MAQQSSSTERQGGVRLAYAIADAVMHIHRERVGRGPTRAQAFFRRNVVVVVMEDTLTRGEKNLVTVGRGAAARAIRAHFAQMMKADLVAAVQELTGAVVVAFLSDSSPDPDVSVEVFVLDRPVPGDGAGEAADAARYDGDGRGRPEAGADGLADGLADGRADGGPGAAEAAGPDA